jgi:hypothetical protein
MRPHGSRDFFTHRARLTAFDGSVAVAKRGDWSWTLSNCVCTLPLHSVPQVQKGSTHDLSKIAPQAARGTPLSEAEARLAGCSHVIMNAAISRRLDGPQPGAKVQYGE